FSSYLSADDYAAREDLLLYGSQGQAAQALLPFLAPDQRAVAQARMALRGGQSDGELMVAALPASLRTSAGVTYEEALRDGRRGGDYGEQSSVTGVAGAVPEEAQSRMWRLRKPMGSAPVKGGGPRAA